MNKKIIVSESQLKKEINKQSEQAIKSLNAQPSLNEIYENTNNRSRLISVNETNAKRLLDRHSNVGYAIVSACRGFSDFGLDDNNPADAEKLNQINKERTRNMISLISSIGFSYTISYGGFIENQGTEDEESVYEISCIIYANRKDGSIDVVGMRNLALEICEKYNQDCVLVKMPNGKPQYLTKDGNVDMEFDGGVAFNDIMQTYFTDLHKNTQKKIAPNSKPTRFSFLESYIAPKPQCYSESHIRSLKGEIFLKK